MDREYIIHIYSIGIDIDIDIDIDINIDIDIDIDIYIYREYEYPKRSESLPPNHPNHWIDQECTFGSQIPTA